jgi:hypothetical protein
VLCAPARAAWSMVNGKVLIEGGELLTLDSVRITRLQQRLAVQLVRGDH